jgi:zinc D-Ala-D-Ala carboxypeptidase
MKNPRIHAVLIVAIIVALAAILSLSARNSRGQSPAGKTEQQNSKVESLVKPTALHTERSAANPNTVTIAPFADAAAHNSMLRNELTWSFGKKGQRGWYLYDLLIGETFNISHNASSIEFAATIAGWQKQKGLSVSGVLDEDSWMALVMQWQANRLKDKTPATPDQLLTAPTSDFYDPSRLDELRQVERETYQAYKAMVAAAIADPTLKLAHTSATELASTEKFFKIISSFRSREYQEKLRRESPNAGSAGLAVNSPHFTGRALDIYVGGDPVDTKDANRAMQVSTPAYKWLVKNAERFGFRPYFYEPWHWEYVK